MRLIAFILYLNFLLLGGNQQLYAGMHQSPVAPASVSNLVEKKSDKISNKDQDTTLFEDTDLDLEEEYLTVEKAKGNSTTKLLLQKYSYPNSCQLGISRTVATKQDYTVHKNFPANFGQSSPIYITQRVLRI